MHSRKREKAMPTVLARQIPSAVPAGSSRALRSAIEHSQDVAAVAQLPDDQLVLFLKHSTGLTNSARLHKALSQLSSAFARAAAVIESRNSARILREARNHADTVRRSLVSRKEVVSSSELTDALGISRQALNKAVHANRMFAVESGGQNYYPVFFADGNLERRQLEKVAKRLGNLSGWDKWLFFTTPKASLERQTPIAALRKGKYADVLRAAAGYAER